MGFDIRLKHRGRTAVSLPAVLGVRALTPEDVAALPRGQGQGPSPLQRVSARHRRLAKAVASGMTRSQVARMFGLTPVRVGQLLEDPTFKELVARRAQEIDAAEIGYIELANDVACDALSTLQDRLEDDPDEFTADELTRIAQVIGDRAGFAPKRVEERNINLNFGDRLEAARQRVKQAVIETAYEDITEAAE